MRTYAKANRGTEIRRQREVRLLASPAELRALAGFLQACAEQLEDSKFHFGHRHFTDYEGFPGGKGFDVVVMSGQEHHEYHARSGSQ